MAIPVSEILGKVSTVLNDSDFVRWTETELIGWINDAAAEVVIRRPYARPVVEGIILDAGPLQSIPENGIQLLDVTYAEGGYIIGRVDRKLLDEQKPDWRRMKQGRTKHFMFEEYRPKLFHVYPPAVAGAEIYITYSAPPPPASANTDTIDIGREYLSPIISFVLYRALAKDSEFGNGALAAAHYQAFSEAIAVRNETPAVTTPGIGGV